jgi:CheY-like chemotaxis protein
MDTISTNRVNMGVKPIIPPLETRDKTASTVSKEDLKQFLQMEHELFRPLRILLIDDSKTQLTLYSTLLRTYIHKMDILKCFNCPKEALRHIQMNSYDLIITDNYMPKMTGVELINKMVTDHGIHADQCLLISANPLPIEDRTNVIKFVPKLEINSIIREILGSIVRVKKNGAKSLSNKRFGGSNFDQCFDKTFEMFMQNSF